MPPKDQYIGPTPSGAVLQDVDGPAACHHCGEPCLDGIITLVDKPFCCQGCKMVYEILSENGLCRYYEIDELAPFSLRGQRQKEYAYLDEPEVIDRLMDFTDEKRSRITLFLPQIHCASCIWLLENLYKLDEGVMDSRVNISRRELHLTFDHGLTSLRSLVELLVNIGYEPAINLGDLEKECTEGLDRSLYYRIGLAGFAFGNIMLLSFPEYLGLDGIDDIVFQRLFGYLNLLLILPVVFYSGSDYLRSAYRGLRHGQLNIDLPISIGILALFGRSTYEILSHTGAGYLDSLAGLVFFLLIGKWFQQRTYQGISFDRNYKSYFPVAANRIENGTEKSVSLDKLQPGDRIAVRHGDLIPADGILVKGKGQIDYSFVTGESEWNERGKNEKVFAGGRQMGGLIELALTRTVSQSYLTELWNNEAFTKERDSRTGQLADRVGKYFTLAILAISSLTLLYWLPRDQGIAFNAFTAVLIIACPCAVALAVPFIFGNVMRILGKRGLYLKNTYAVEAFSRIDAIVFDKTGTLSSTKKGRISWVGRSLSKREKAMVYELVRPSSHPKSRLIAEHLRAQAGSIAELNLQDWTEVAGKGLRAIIDGKEIRLGSANWLREFGLICSEEEGVYLTFDGEVRGRFTLESDFRKGMAGVIDYFRQWGPMYLLSGDSAREKIRLDKYFHQDNGLHFDQSPQQKLDFIRQLQCRGRKVLMLGDGLNDAGALKQSDLGLAITEDTGHFTPACDGVLDAGCFDRLHLFSRYARSSLWLVYGAYAFALVYNVIGLSFAVQGTLSPIVAAILMPLSSISIVLYGFASSSWLGKVMWGE
ncbi:MAG: heavy metal translocating P-type ATPase metal-binding domain-containing protein [Saprospiraceae bacterium]|nr:heavy metal translocating P-type ATPase metal-binding domain-containing protein [Saprospiraceae bacterium]